MEQIADLFVWDDFAASHLATSPFNCGQKVNPFLDFQP